MNPLLWIFEFVFRCRHRQLSRVFTIKRPNLSGSASIADGNLTCRTMRNCDPCCTCRSSGSSARTFEGHD